MLCSGRVLGDERGPHAELAGELLRQLGAAGVRRDGHVLLRHDLVEEVLRQHRARDQVVDRDLEEALDLAGVQVHREHAVGARRLEHARDEPGRDRLARQRLLVLARVAEPGRDRDDAVRGGALGRVDHQQQLHQVAVHRRVRRLHDEDVRAADRLQVAAVDLAVGERLQLDLPERDAELAGDLVRRAPGCRARRTPSGACRRRSGRSCACGAGAEPSCGSASSSSIGAPLLTACLLPCASLAVLCLAAAALAPRSPRHSPGGRARCQARPAARRR